MGSVGSDELLVARQADDGGAGELRLRRRAAGGRRGVGQVPRRHGLEEPLGRRRACGRAGRRRWRPVGSSRHAQSAARTRDAKTPRRGSTPRRREDEQRAKGHRKRTGQRGDDVDEAQRPQRGQAPARGRASPCVVMKKDAAPYSAGNENGTFARSAESAGRKHARTARTTTPSASFSGLAPPAAAPLALVPFLGSVQLDTPVRSLT